MPALHLAQVNLATLRAPVDDPVVAEFMAALDPVNALADAAPGFVWRLQTDEGNATSITAFPDPRRILNLSVWRSPEAVADFVFRSGHIDFLRRRREWFVAGSSSVAAWWVPEGEPPSVDEAVRRAAFLERHGPSPYAFTVTRPLPPLLLEEARLDDPGTRELVRRLNAELAAVATEPGENHFSLTVEETSGANGRMVRARYEDRLVGCGAVRRIEPEVGELKRMFVDPSVRGLKIGAAILDRLELLAAELGLGELKLETGVHQPAAIGLYEGTGYEPCELWGEYLLSPATSRCYRKLLPTAPGGAPG